MRRRNGYFPSGSRCADFGASQVAASARKGAAEASGGEGGRSGGDAEARGGDGDGEGRGGASVSDRVRGERDGGKGKRTQRCGHEGGGQVARPGDW